MLHGVSPLFYTVSVAGLHRRSILKGLNKNRVYGLCTLEIILIKGLPGGRAEIACQPLLLVRVAWQRMSLCALFHLEVVFDAT